MSLIYSLYIHCKISLQKFFCGILPGILLILLTTFNSNAVTGIDTLKKDTSAFTGHSPKRAAIMSAMLPGLGQAYNHKYWKIPIAYGGFAVLGYSFFWNQQEYLKFKNAYKALLNQDPNTVESNVKMYLSTKLYSYRRNRDLSIIGCAAIYILNIVDASVDAHLFTFDVSDDLSLIIQPSVFSFSSTQLPKTGLSLTLNLK